jgi:acyl dehydratase
MSDLYLDDLHPGDAWTGMPIAITEADILHFAGEYDPQPMHLDPEAARAGRFGGLIASGWHVASLMMRDFVETRPFGDVPLLGIGLNELHWLKPVRPGDTLLVRREILEVQRSQSKPHLGTVALSAVATNQHGEEVVCYTNLLQIPVRPLA